MVDEVAKERRTPRTARALGNTNDGWYYVNGSSIDIYGELIDSKGERQTTSLRLYRKQLERALQLMGAV